jgi:hypothetical protein
MFSVHTVYLLPLDLFMLLYLYLQQESGGTVLSTNWKEVEREKVEVKAPDGMEWRKWEQ